MARKTDYQTIPDAAGSSNNTPTQPTAAPTTLSKTSSHSSQNSLHSNNNGSNNPTSVTSGVATGSAGVPPKIINPTKQAFTQQSNQHQSPIHAQIPGSANVTAKANMAASSAGAAGSGRPTALTTAHNLSSTGSPVTAGGVSNAAVNLRGKVKQPMRTTKTSQKLTLFPEEKEVPVLEDEYAFDDTTYNQIGQLSSGTARNDAHRMSKLDRQKLPRVIAYCTASSYRMDDLFNYLQSRKTVNGAAPKRFDECIYTPFSYTTTSKPPTTGDLLGLDEAATNGPRLLEQQRLKENTPELFFFDYGVTVIWGMSEQEESRLLQEISRFEEEKLDEEDVETEEFSYHYNSEYQPRIYNDVITLKSAVNYMVKLTISHAIAQSVKMTLFEGLIENTINATKNIPQTMAETGKVPMSRTAITKKIGQLFIMRINVNLVSNILDTPEIFWSEPSFQPLYSAIRGYLEISQRVELLNQRTSVISDLLDMLKEHLNSSHGEQLEWIVIVLIFFEIVIGVITICLDAFSYSRADELAQKYKEKALARRRGAGYALVNAGKILKKTCGNQNHVYGTHQPKFRGFTLTKKLEAADPSLEVTNKTTPGAEITTSTATTTIQQVETIEIQADVPESGSYVSRTVETGSSGLNEKYQERLKARFRGAGTHRSDFRGFTLKPTKNVVEPTKQTSAASIQRPSGAELRAESTNRRKPVSNTQDSHPTTKGVLSNAFKELSIDRDSANKDTLEKPASSGDVNPRTRSEKFTRSTSRSAGYSPNFKIAWGKNSTTLTSDSRKQPNDRDGGLSRPRSEQRPIIEDTIDDVDVMGDFDNDVYDHHDQIPSPVRNSPEPITNHLEPATKALASKRKIIPPVSDTAPTSTSGVRKPGPSSGAAPAKKRRLIQEEEEEEGADENEDPQPVHQNRSLERTNESGKGLEKSAVTAAKKTPADKNGKLARATKSKDVSRAPPARTTSTSKPATTTTRTEGVRPFRQTTLMQLSSKPARNDGDQSRVPPRRQDDLDDSDGSESDFERTQAKVKMPMRTVDKGKDKDNGKNKRTTSMKGPSTATVKSYKQLQIHCLKFWGPFSNLSRPAAVSNKATARQLAVRGNVPGEQGSASKQKTVQDVLQFEDAPLSEMDVVADAVRDVVDKYIDSIEDQNMAKEMMVLRSELETVLIEQVDLLDDHILLRASVKKAAAVKKELRVRLLETQRQRRKTREELQRVRASFEREERARRRLEETHKFLTDLEALRDHVADPDDEEEEDDDDEEEDKQTGGQGKANLKTGLQSLIATVGSRCGGRPRATENEDSQAGVLGTLREFNRLLEATEKSLQSMPLVNPSLETTSSRSRNDYDDSDSD
ncbi:hypothetical protein BGZ54_009757 [Gamsiella multidivaricata]|nr:hypothetical protein BGZ54_009757 [Gamsiella multidivaricata]